MKFAPVPHAVLLMALLAPLAAQQPQAVESKLEIRDAATHESLEGMLRHAHAHNPLAHFKVDEGPDPTKENRPVNIIEDSDIISFNGLTTLVPKRAILAIPDAFRHRIGQHVPGHRVVAWKDFHFANRGWISTVGLSRSQAEGKEALPEAVTERMSRTATLMVAIYQGGPISVLPLKQHESGVETASTAVE